jgi:hypothetical protein
MGLKFGTGGITMGGSGSLGGGNVANGRVANINVKAMVNNHATALALARGGLGVPSNTNATDHVAVANIQYGTSPTYGSHHQQQHNQHPGLGMNKGTADKCLLAKTARGAPSEPQHTTIKECKKN